MPQMRHTTAAELPATIDLLVAAFDEDPFFRWMFPGPAFEAGLREWFALLIGIAFTKGHTYLAAERSVATVWLPPDVPLAHPDDYETAAGIVATHSSPAHSSAVFQVIGAAAQHRPGTPNWQLMYVGVTPASQGHGEGREALAGTLAICDAQHFPAYLHSTNPRNVSFYERLDFRVIAEVPTVEDGPVIRPMWREPLA